MFYNEALDYIRRIEADGSDYGLERERELLDLLASPDTRYPVIHIAGTNGKGSVSAMLTAVLVAAGYRVGTYNSPSVLRYNERFLIDGSPLPDEKVARYMTAVRLATEREAARRRPDDRSFRPTAFEQETALALLAFAAEGCGVAVLETGLGGRWDATNAVRDKALAVITKIGLDHCALLGDTLGEIAAEKAAIIRGAAVTCPQEKAAADVLYPLADRISGVPRLIRRTPFAQRFSYYGEEYETRLTGDHQLVNAALVIEAVIMLRERGFVITDAALRQGLSSAVWHARFEVLTEDNVADTPYVMVIPHGKTVVLDGAHNPQGAASLAAALAENFCGSRIAAVAGVLADKDHEGVMREVLPLTERVYAVTPDSPRALSAEALSDDVKRVCDASVEVRGGVREGLEAALASDAEVVVVFGSLTLFHELVRDGR